jgi:HEAT repeat protein
MAQKENLSNLQISESMVNMITLLDKLAASFEKKDQDRISQQIGNSIAAMDSDMAQQLKAQKIEHLFGGALMKYFVRETLQDKPVKPLASPAGAPDKTKKTEPIVLQEKPNPQNQTIRVAVKPPTSPENTPIKTKNTEPVAPQEKPSPQNQIIQLKEKLRTLPKDDQKIFLDAPMMSALPKIFEQLDAQKEHEAMAIIISRLVGNMFSKTADVRLQSSTALAEIFEGLARERQDKLIERLSGRLIDWIKEEPLATLAYKKICNNLKNLVQNFINEGRLTEAIPILDVLSNISTGIMEKNDKAHEICLNIIKELAAEQNLTVLFKSFNTNNANKQVNAGSVLVRLGDGAMNRLLDILRDKVDSDERVRIVNLFIGIGKRAVPVIRDRVSKTAPWYYLRNLAYILGHIGNESSAGALQPLLLHENKRLRLEALKSIYKTGGKERAHILLSALPQADDSFKINIVETLGNAKCVEAVPELIKMLKKGKSVAQALRDDLEEKICVSLGTIGSPEALSILSKITKPNFILPTRSYSKKVKIAAGIAAVSIRKKQEETDKKVKVLEKEGKKEEAIKVLDVINISK